MTRGSLFKWIVPAGLLVAVVFGTIGGGAIASHDEGTPEASPQASPGATMDMGGTGAAYLTVRNEGETDRLLGGQTDKAEAVEVHEVVDEGGVMQMRPLADGLEIPAGGEVILEPGGYHLMLFGLTEDLVVGMTFDLTLRFERAGDVVVSVVVRRSAPEGDDVQTVRAGDLTIAGAWARPAPALRESLGTPSASPTM